MTQEQLNNFIDELLGALDRMVPVHGAFRRDLRPMIHEQKFSIRQPLLIPPAYALLAWYTVDVVVIATEMAEDGQDKVVRIVLPGQIFTDLYSFFKDKPSRIKFTPITEGNLLVIRRGDYKKLEVYQETNELVRHIMLMEKEAEAQRSRLMSQKPKEKFALFAKEFPLAELPNKYCASYLNLDEADYSRLKADYLKNL